MSFSGTESCGNSPKNLLVARFEEHLFHGDSDSLAEVIAEDCVLEIVSGNGVEATEGREAIVEVLTGLAAREPLSGHVEAAIAHGKAAATWGQWEMPNGASQHFSHTMWFRTHKGADFARIKVFQP